MSGRNPRAWWVVALLALLVAPGSALACSCSWGGPFTKVALGTDLVVLVEVRGDLALGRIIVPQHGRSLETVSLADMLAWIRSGGAGRIAPTGPSP